MQTFKAINAYTSTLEIDLTEKCNMQCSYCYKGSLVGETLSLDTGKHMIDLLCENEHERVYVYFMGGEPFLEFDLMMKLVDYGLYTAACKDKTFRWGATSNLTLLDDAKARLFKEKGGILHASIDGCPAAHDKCRLLKNGQPSSSLAYAGAKYALQIAPDDSVRASLVPKTVPLFFESTQCLYNIGYTKVAFIPVYEADWTPEDIELFDTELRKVSDYYIAQFRKGHSIYFKLLDEAMRGLLKPRKYQYACGVGTKVLACDVYGRVWPCHRFAGINKNQDWCLGHYEGELDEEKISKFKNFDGMRVSSECEYCPAVFTCRLGCPAINYQCTQNLRLPPLAYCCLTRRVDEHARRTMAILIGEHNTFFYNAHKNFFGIRNPIDKTEEIMV